MNFVLDAVAQHKRGLGGGVFCVCSAHPLVIEAALLHARDTGTHALIEATSNQVNQDGGYTGMKPVDFAAFVHSIAAKIGLPAQRVLLGGDHLGPNSWQHLNADEAMAKSLVLVASYVEAGFRKIHLDCSMSCAGDPSPLGDELIARRATRLAAAAEAAWQRAGGEAPIYIIGSEVPVPGGAHETLNELAVTSPEAAAATVTAHRRAFDAESLSAVWPRVVGLVVQPGVEFDHHAVFDYAPAAAAALSQHVDQHPTLVYEAHSTDYQNTAALRALVRDHFAILKVGPGLTFALREALWALDRIESEWTSPSKRAGLKNVVLAAMQRDPRHWRKYYVTGTPDQVLLDQQYSLSDRIRYYWPFPEVQAAVSQLMANLDAAPPPLALLSQYMPAEFESVRNGRLRVRSRELLMHRVRGVLTRYADACTQGDG
jgi:D-tagatose-1,6-bisphosphate aldolase subunit GatZ/KbaZ